MAICCSERERAESASVRRRGFFSYFKGGALKRCATARRTIQVPARFARPLAPHSNISAKVREKRERRCHGRHALHVSNWGEQPSRIGQS